MGCFLVVAALILFTVIGGPIGFLLGLIFIVLVILMLSSARR